MPCQPYGRGCGVILKPTDRHWFDTNQNSHSLPWQHYQRSFVAEITTIWHRALSIRGTCLGLSCCVSVWAGQTRIGVSEGPIAERKHTRIWRQIFNVPHLKWLKVRECEPLFHVDNKKVKWLRQSQSKDGEGGDGSDACVYHMHANQDIVVAVRSSGESFSKSRTLSATPMSNTNQVTRAKES